MNTQTRLFSLMFFFCLLTLTGCGGGGEANGTAGTGSDSGSTASSTTSPAGDQRAENIDPPKAEMPDLETSEAKSG
ncbi:MAG: hypothetical protein AAF570_20510, partial [Bacteroidota bacterium]